MPGGYGTLDGLLRLQSTLARTYIADLLTLERATYEPTFQARRVELTQELLAALSNELEELRDETPWKPWRKPFTMSYSQYCNLRFELVDVLHFLLELALVWGFSADDLWETYTVKREHNLTRPEHVHR